MTKSTKMYLILAAIILISAAGGTMAVYATANGPWGYTDPVVYISTARSLDRGQGLVYYEADAAFRPITIQPPFYPIVLGAIGLFHSNLVAAARWLNIFAFVASIFISGWIFIRYSRVPELGIAASALMCAFPQMVVMFSSAYSEPLFILLFLSGGLVLLAALQTKRTSLLLLSAVLIGLIPATRYAGISMVLAGGISVLLLMPGKWWTRIRQAVLFTLVASLPILLWLVWIYFATAHSVGGRSLGLNWQGFLAQFQAFRTLFMDTIWKWVPFQPQMMNLQYRLRFIILGIGLASGLVITLMAGRHLRKNPEGGHPSGLQIFTLFGLSSVAFFIVVLGTYLFTTPTIDVDNRMLLPLYVGFVMSFYSAFALWQAAWFKGRLRTLQLVPWLIMALCAAWYFPQTREKVNFYHSGDGLTSYEWDRSETILAVRALPAGQPVISNDWELLQLWTGRPIFGFWNTFPTKLPVQAGAYGTEPDDPVQSVFCEQGAALVIFEDFPNQFQAQVGEADMDLLAGLFEGLPLYGTYPDGKIYLCR